MKGSYIMATNPKILLFERIDKKLEILNSHHPLSPVVVLKLKEQFAIEMTYNSNAIEGNRLTRDYSQPLNS